MRFALLFVLVCLCGALHAQQATSDFWEDPLGEGDDSDAPQAIEPAWGLFERPLDLPYGGDPFSRLSDFNFSATRYNRRGYDFSWEQNHLHDLELGDAISGRLDYNLLTALRYAPGLHWREQMLLRPLDGPDQGRVSLLASDRAGRVGFRAAMSGSLGGGWFYGASASRRWGRDAQIDGIFLDQTAFSAAVQRLFGGNRHSVALIVAGAPTERSSRTATTRELYRLTGDNLYNPSWGHFDGQERSSRIRSGAVPLAALILDIDLGGRHLEVDASWQWGERRFSGLNWYDAASPLPDYYRYLPSFIAEPMASQQVAAMWRAGDERVTQIDWSELSYQNRMAGGQAVYMTSEDVERVQNLQFVATMRRKADHPEVEYRYGIRARIDRTENFRQVRDLLGADYLVDVDQFLIDDEFYGDQAQNDLRHPDRRVSSGRFGYDYRLRRDYVGVFGTLTLTDYQRARRLEISARGGDVSLQREGFYEKELFAGNRSFGKSDRSTFFDYHIRIEASTPIAQRHYLSLRASFENRAPLAADLFLQQRYNNATIDNPCATGVWGGELDYRFVGEALQLWINGFYTQTRDGSEVRHYYDDLSSEYGDFVLSGVAKRYYGVELGAQLRLSPRLMLQLAAATGSYTYSANPRADLFADADGGRIYVGGRVPLEGFRLGTSPQSVASGELRYSGTRGWMLSLSASYMADHYIAPDPTRRMARATAYAASPETFEAMTAQERFDPAFTLGAFVWKRFTIAGYEFAASLSIDNLLDNRRIVYSGYEPMRLRRSGEGVDRTYVPHDSKYLYNRGRTWYASLTYRF